MHYAHDVMRRMCYYVVDGHALGKVIRFWLLCSTWLTKQEKKVIGGNPILDGP